MRETLSAGSALENSSHYLLLLEGIGESTEKFPMGLPDMTMRKILEWNL